MAAMRSRHETGKTETEIKEEFEQKKQERINQQLKAKEEWEQDKKRKIDEVL